MKSSLLTFLFLLSISVFEAQCVINCSITATDEQTYNGCDGTVTLTSSGGSGNQFIYILIDYSTGLEVNRDTSMLQPYTFQNVCVGTYAYIIQDINGVNCCNSDACPAGPPCTGSGSGGTATVGSAAATLNVSCVINYGLSFCPNTYPSYDPDDVDVEGEVVGGNADYDYIFNQVNGAGASSGWNTSSTTDLYETLYGVGLIEEVELIVVDADGAWGSGTCYTVATPPPPLSYEISHDCSGTCSGRVVVKYAPNTFYDNSVIFPLRVDFQGDIGYINSSSDSLVFENLCPGDYNVTAVEDGMSCRICCPMYDYFTLDNVAPPSLTLDYSPDCGFTCSGAVHATANSGLAPYSYMWWDEFSTFVGTSPDEFGLCDGEYSCKVTDSNGCTDSTSTMLYHALPSQSEDSIVACDSYTWTDGVTYTSSNNIATQSYTNVAGCDSVVSLDLTVNYTSYASEIISACDDYLSPSGNYTWVNTGSYLDTIPNVFGCDSVITVDLTINNNVGDTAAVVCNDFNWYGNFYTSSGTYTHALTNVAGCDSLVTLNLTINYGTTGDTTAVVCDSFDWYGNTYTASGDYTHLLTNVTGCDSLVTLHLTINSSSSGTDMITACDSYTWIDGITYVSSNNTATYTLTNSMGCDSVVSLDLTINYSNSGDTTVVACDSFYWYGVTYTSSGDYTYLLTNISGCDSTVTLHLTINGSSTGTDVIIACDSYTWLNGVTYISSNNTATHTLSNAAGCDSIVTLNLIINYSTNGDTTAVVCDSFDWYGNIYTASGDYTHLLTNVTGCDSLVTLHLTINSSSSGTDMITACDSYTWIDGITYVSSNNTATYTLTNSMGCDSVVSLDLIINTVDISVIDNPPTLTANATGATYQWVDCDDSFGSVLGETSASFTATSPGNYAVEVTQNGCTSTSECVSVMNVGIISEFNGLKIYPNPTNGLITINLKDIAMKVDRMEVRNQLGQLVLNVQSNEQTIYQIDLSKEPSGIYFLKMITERGDLEYKMLKL